MLRICRFVINYCVSYIIIDVCEKEKREISQPQINDFSRKIDTMKTNSSLKIELPKNEKLKNYLLI